MVGGSKILTVSYGTFSCTLEGFDDPFGTMRGIAEYFRDLAADDRYFGAEPPTPDPEMLHRIAEAEVKRRVEARVGNDGVTLRQLEADRQQAPAATPTDDENLFSDLGDADDEAAETEAARQQNGSYGEGPVADGTSVAAKLSRIRAVVAGDAAARTSDFSGSIEDAFADEEDATPAKRDPREELDAIAEAGESPSPLTDEDEPQAEDVAAEAAMWSDPAHAMDASDEDEADERVAAETEASSEESVDDAIASEDEDDEDISDVVQETVEAESDEPEADDIAAETEDEVADEAPAPELIDETTAPEHQEHVAEVREHHPGEAGGGLAARIVRLKKAALGAQAGGFAQPEAAHDTAAPESDAAHAIDEDTLDDDDDLTADADSEEAAHEEDNIFAEDDAAEPEAASEEDGDEAQDDDAQTREDDGRRLTAEGDVEDGLDIDFDLDDPFGDGRTATPHRGDSVHFDPVTPPEGEDAPKRVDPATDANLAAMIAELKQADAPSADGDDATDEDEAPADEPAEHEQREARRAAMESGSAGEASVDRLLEQTNTRMDDSEGNRRRSAIAHLKAAVAATKADRLLKRRATHDVSEQSPYRDDLAKVVRPRPSGEDEEEERPRAVESRPTPLVLVSEQRISDEDLGGIAPRRVNSEPLNPESEDAENERFAEFAERMGATELPDLLEAAAAFCAYVEGNREFSRPHLMRRVANFQGGEAYTREAGLRSFGQLLRQGKLQKLKRGQFTVTEETRFNPEARIAGE